MSRKRYKKMDYTTMLTIARLSLNSSMTHEQIASAVNIPRRTVSHFLARRGKQASAFWVLWDNESPETKEKLPKIFIFDIETAPILGYFWQMFNQNMSLDMIENDWFIMTWAGKWFGEETIYYDTCINHGFTAERYFTAAMSGDKDDLLELDRNVVASLWAKLEEADMIVAHNGDKFDMKKVTARAIQQGLQPMSPIKQIDTMKIAKRVACFTSNKLDHIAHILCGERKVDTGGFNLWKNCLRGIAESWSKMLEYNINDVTILENVWVALAPYDRKSPSLIMHVDSEVTRCNSPACGSFNVEATGKTYKTTVSEFTVHRCTDCGKQMRGRKNMRTKEQLAITMLSV